MSLGVSVGGIRNFPDNIINNGTAKPWKNLEVKVIYFKKQTILFVITIFQIID